MQSKSDRAGKVSSGRKAVPIVQHVGEWLRSQWRGLFDVGAPAPKLQPIPVRTRNDPKRSSSRPGFNMRSWS